MVDLKSRKHDDHVDGSSRGTVNDDVSVERGEFAPLHRKLKSRHLQMIAIGGMHDAM